MTARAPSMTPAWACTAGVVEQSIALLHWFRRLRIRWEIRDDIHEAFLSLACAIICWRRLRHLSLC
jgi:peptidoglycan biosynthesis protein MviN/MurJ (putative lipid II flippase)